MNEGLNPHQPSVEERIASFARIANILAAFARAGARLRGTAVIRARANAPAEALHALEVPARGAPTRGRAPVADAVPPQESRRTSPRSARPLTSVLAAGNARSAPIAEVRSGRARNERIAPAGETSERAPSSPRVATTDALAAVRAGSIAVSRVRQLTLHANLQGAQENGRTAGGSAIAAPDISPAPRVRALNIAAMLTASSAARRTIAEDRHARNFTTAPEAIEPSARYRGATRASEAATAIAMLPARIQRVLASSRAPADEFSLRADLADPSHERTRDFGARGGRPSANVAAPITINSSPSITVNLPAGAAASGESGISRAVAQALEEHAERLYEMMRQVGAFRERTEF
jgi:hypothetical protein